MLTRKKTQTIDLKEKKKEVSHVAITNTKKKWEEWEETIALKEDPNTNESLSFIHVKS